MNIVFARRAFMVGSIHCQLISSVDLLRCSVPNNIILPALTGPSRKFNFLNSMWCGNFGNNDIKCASFWIIILNTNLTCQRLFNQSSSSCKSTRVVNTLVENMLTRKQLRLRSKLPSSCSAIILQIFSVICTQLRCWILSNPKIIKAKERCID